MDRESHYVWIVACLSAAAITLAACVTCWGWIGVSKNTALTPSRAGPRVSGSRKSPETTSTPRSPSDRAFDPLRTSVRTSTSAPLEVVEQRAPDPPGCAGDQDCLCVRHDLLLVVGLFVVRMFVMV